MKRKEPAERKPTRRGNPAPSAPAACTIITRSRLSFARVLASSYLKHHPGARFYLLVVDKLPQGIEAGPGIQVIDPKELYLPYLNELCFKCTAVELCATLKPTLLTLLLNRYHEQSVAYFDADTLVMRRLDELIASLGSADIVLTPHVLKPPPLDGLHPDEHEILTAGVYNAGFVAVRESDETHRFLRWWQARLRDCAITEYAEGLFIDRKWLDLVPALFPATILKDDTFNVSYWNLDSRSIERKARTFSVHGRPLASFHARGVDPANRKAFSKYQNRVELEQGSPVADLIDQYVESQLANGFDEASQWTYAYDAFDNGTAIHPLFRKLYASLDPRKRVALGDPFHTAGENSFFAWATRTHSAGHGLSPFLKEVYDSRPDVAAAFPEVARAHRQEFMEWAFTSGAEELNYDPIAMGVPREIGLIQPVAPEVACVEPAVVDHGPLADHHPFVGHGRSPASLKCSIIIPVFNKASLTRNCLESLFSKASLRDDFEVIVADDASSDHTSELLKSYGPRIRVVSHQVNGGFSASCNDGAAVARGEYLIFLNNDTVSLPGWVDSLIAYADHHPQAAIVGSKLLFPNDTIQHAGMVMCEDLEPRHIYTGFPADHPLVNKSRRFQVVTGGCFLIRRDDFDRAQGFDLGFRNGYEDVDLCLRIGELGREVHYCHESVLYHLEAVSRDIKADEASNRDLYRSRWAHKVRPDEFDYYYEDGLLKVDYRPLYPIGLSVSPLLGVSTDGDRGGEVDRVLSFRSRQVFGLLKDNIRLNVRAQEAEYRSDLAKTAPNPRSSPSSHSPISSPKVIHNGHMHRLSPQSTNRIVSIILPVKNGGSKLRELLPAIVGQRTRDLVEIIAVDSGSSDDSVDLLRKADATVISIDPRSFNHGLTRNLATQHARGNVFVFLNQSTLPADEKWLAQLIAPFDADPSLAAVCGRVLPRTDADLLTARDIARNVNASTERMITAISDPDRYRALKREELRRFVNFHTLSAAIRAEVFRKIPFRDAAFAEDLIWGKEALEAGLRIQFEPSSVAFHSHNYSALDILRRNFDDGAACRKIVGRALAEADVVPEIMRQVRDDWRYLESECRLQSKELDEWRLTSAMRRTAQLIGHWMGVNHEHELGLISQLSIVERIKAGAETESTQTGRTLDARAAG